MTALEIYREDRQNRRDPAKRRPRQEYFILLRDTLHEELAVEGRSEFLEEMIAEGSGKALPVLEFAALRECFAAIVDGRRMRDASDHVPHILRGENQPLTWAELESGTAFRVDDPQMPDMLLRLRNVAWQLVNARDQTPAVGAERAVNREIAGLRAVNRALEKDNNDLRAEREELRARIAQLEEGVISQQLQNRVNARRYQLEGEMAEEMAQKRQAAEAEMRRALARAANEARQAQERIAREAAEQDAARAAAFQAERGSLMNALAQQLAAMQQTLHGADHRFLAQSYAGLRGAMCRAVTDVIGSAQAHGADETLLNALTAMDATLSVQLRRMEQAMLQLGLQVFQPEEGERFDSALHSPASAGAQDAADGLLAIASVQTPGVRMIHADGQSEILVRAVVCTRNRNDGAAAPGAAEEPS